MRIMIKTFADLREIFFGKVLLQPKKTWLKDLSLIKNQNSDAPAGFCNASPLPAAATLFFDIC